MRSFFLSILILTFSSALSQGEEPMAWVKPVSEKNMVEWDSVGDSPSECERRITPTRNPEWQTRYRLGPGDALNFSMYDRPDLARLNVTIAPDGTVSYLQAVSVRAKGLTLDQLRSRIESELSEYHKNVKVIVTPATIASKDFSIIGRVRKPGSYTLDRPISILEGIALAEGIEVGSVRGSAYELADFERSFVARRGLKLDVDLSKLYYEGDLSQNAYLEPDDYIYIASSLKREYFVLGSVNNPGRLKMPIDVTMAGAIAQAGGFSKEAYKMRVLLIRGSIHNPETQIVDMKAILTGKQPDFKVENRDIIFVSKRPFELVERVLDNAIFTFVQTVTAEAMDQNYNPILLND